MTSLPSLSGRPMLDTILLLMIIYAVSWYRSYWRLSRIPGPHGWGLSILPWVYLHTKGRHMHDHCELNAKYGPLVRVGPNTLMTSDADTLRKISAPRSAYHRSMNYYAMRLNPGKDHIFSPRDEKLHDDLRKKMSAGYSGKENLTLEDDMNECIQDLCDLIDKKYLTTAGNVKPMDLARKISFLVMDIISKASFDSKFHDLRDDNDNHQYIKEIENLLPNITWTAAIPGFVKFMTDTGIAQFIASKADGSFGVEKVKRIAAERVDLRFDSDGNPKPEMRQDMLGSFIRRGLTQECAREEAVLNLTAGSDTTATIMRAVLLNVITSPRLYGQLVTEIDTGIANGTLPRGEGEVVSEIQAKQLPLLQACIKEGLRWYPAVAAELSKLTPPEGDTICGYFVPGGTKVGMSIKHTHRNIDLYGPDQNAFRSTRWLLAPSGSRKLPQDLETSSWTVPDAHPLGDELEPGRLFHMERNNDLTFGHGRFACLGKPVALMELNKIFIELLRRYEFQIMDPKNPWYTQCCGTHLQSDMWVTVRRREE